jgi:hypothetical protein
MIGGARLRDQLAGYVAQLLRAMYDVQRAPPRARRARGLPRTRARRLLLLSRGGPVHTHGGPVPVRQQLRDVPRVGLRSLVSWVRDAACPISTG